MPPPALRQLARDVASDAERFDVPWIGEFVRCDEQGRPIVRFAGEERGAVARLAAEWPQDEGRAGGASCQVVLLFEQADRRRPVIVAFVRETLTKPAVPETSSVEGRRIDMIGEDEVVVRCGKASITLRADGQVLIRGTRVTSRASETNKIRGATVSIN